MNRRIYLRAFEPEDYKIIVKWRNDRDIAEKLGGGYFLLLRRTREKMGARHNLRSR